MLQMLSRIFRFPQWMKIIPDLDAIGNGAQKTSSGHSKDCLLVDEVIPARSLCSLFKVPPFDEAAPETFFTIPAVLTTSPLVIGCGEGSLELVRVQAPGRRAVSGSDYANGAHLKTGDVL